MGRLLKLVSLRAVSADVAGHAVAPAGHTGATKADRTLPASRVEAHRIIHSALLQAGWQPEQARAIVMTADIELAALVANDTLTLHAARLERAMPGIQAGA